MSEELRELINQLDKKRSKYWLPTNKQSGNSIHYMAHILEICTRQLLSWQRKKYAWNLGSGDIRSFAGAEDLINSWTLTYQSSNIKDNFLLLLNQFLIGISGGDFAAAGVDDTRYNLQKRWSRNQQLVKTHVETLDARVVILLKCSP